MKKLLIILSSIILFSITANAQLKPLKIGYTNVDYVILLHPDSKKVDGELKGYRQQLEKQGEELMSEFKEKQETFEKGQTMMSEPVKATRQKELVDMQQRIMEFQRSAEADLQRKQGDLLQPVLDKIQKAINAVAEENGYTYVFNSDAGSGTTPILLYGPEKENITDLILKKLGITPPAKESSKSISPNPAPAKKPTGK